MSLGYTKHKGGGGAGDFGREDPRENKALPSFNDDRDNRPKQLCSRVA